MKLKGERSNWFRKQFFPPHFRFTTQFSWKCSPVVPEECANYSTIWAAGQIEPKCRLFICRLCFVTRVGCKGIINFFVILLRYAINVCEQNIRHLLLKVYSILIMLTYFHLYCGLSLWWNFIAGSFPLIVCDRLIFHWKKNH